MANPKSLKPFKKGDSRINRLGRPKSFDALRKLAQEVAAEQLADGADGITRVALMLKAMSTSKNPADRALFLAYAFGKPKEQVEFSDADIDKKIASLLAQVADGRETKAIADAGADSGAADAGDPIE